MKVAVTLGEAEGSALLSQQMLRFAQHDSMHYCQDELVYYATRIMRDEEDKWMIRFSITWPTG